ncbi:hypothetical protein [Paraburkholderia sp. GAS334]|uniref:hypothetical protein n=1 Tax=Paraburkholderia sp. GAS334 TaxID=3035131 RepID=UPI003D23A4A7
MKAHWTFAALAASLLQVAMATLFVAGDAHAGTVTARPPPPSEDDENGDKPGGQASNGYGSTHNQVATAEYTNPVLAASDTKVDAARQKNAKKAGKAVAPKDKEKTMQ